MKWEYNVLYLGASDVHKTIEALNAAGRDGWEAISVSPPTGKDDDWLIVVLKRPKPD